MGYDLLLLYAHRSLRSGPAAAGLDEPAAAHGEARVNADVTLIYARLHIDAARWQSSLQLLLRPGKLVGQYFRRLQHLREMAARHGKCSAKYRDTPVAGLAV